MMTLFHILNFQRPQPLKFFSIFSDSNCSRKNFASKQASATTLPHIFDRAYLIELIYDGKFLLVEFSIIEDTEVFSPISFANCSCDILASKRASATS